jgi:hypothetical protein
MSLNTLLQTLVQRTGSAAGALATPAQRAAFTRAVKSDLASLIDQVNTVYKPLVEQLVSETGLDALEKGLVGNVVLAHGDATSGSSFVLWNTVKSRPATVKEAFDSLIGEIARLDSLVSRSQASGLEAVRTFIGMDTSTSVPTYSDHGALTVVSDGDSLEEAVQKLDAAVAGAGGVFPDDTYLKLGSDEDFWVGVNTLAFPFEVTLLATNGAQAETVAGGGSSQYTSALALWTHTVITDGAGGGVGSPPVFILTGPTDTANGATGGDSGNIQITTGNADNTDGVASGRSGRIEIFTGESATDNSGPVFISTGNVTAGESGDFQAVTGSGDTKSGDVLIASGGANSTAGAVTIGPGAGGTGVGKLQLGLPTVPANAVPNATTDNDGNGFLPVCYRVQITGLNSPIAIQPPFKGKVFDAQLIKISSTGVAAETIEIQNADGPCIVFDVNGVAPGEILRATDIVTADSDFDGSGFGPATGLTVVANGANPTVNAIVVIWAYQET